MVRLMSDMLLLTVKSDCIGSKWPSPSSDLGARQQSQLVATPIDANCLLARSRKRVGALPNKSLSWSPGSAGYAPPMVVVVWSRYRGPLSDVVDLVP